MIKILTTLNQQSGFETDEAVLEINNYTVNETVQITTGSTTLLPLSGKYLQINYSIYKDLVSKNDGALPFQPVGFPYNITLTPATADVIDETYLYDKVTEKLIELGYEIEGREE